VAQLDDDSNGAIVWAKANELHMPTTSIASAPPSTFTNVWFDFEEQLIFHSPP
jgi:hypothetical protein